MNISRPGCFAFATLSLTLATSPALSQEGTGLRGKLSFDQRLEYSDNPTLATSSSDSELSSRTSLRFDIDSETRTQAFNVFVGGTYGGALGDSADANDDFDLLSEQAGLSYRREGANSQLSFSANYDKVEIDDDIFGFFVDGVFDPEALIIDGGEREITRYRAFFETGTAGPFGVEVTASRRDIDYSGTSDPELVDSETTRLNGEAKFRINPAFTARLLAGISRTDEGDAVDTERNSSYVGAGVEGELNTGLSYSADITLDKTETKQLGTEVSDDDGIGLSLAVTQDRPDGSVGATLSSSIDDTGRRTSASVNRVFELPNGGISVSLGVTDQEDESPEIITTLSYTRELPDAVFQANVVQEPTSSEGTAFLATSIRLNYRQSINSISSWDAGITYGAASEIGSSGSNSRTSATIAYSRDLTADWGLRTGLEVTRIDESGGPDRSSNTVFLSVGRDFSFGF